MSITDPQPVAPKPKLRWYRFSLRLLLIAVAVFCVLMGVNMSPSDRWLGHVLDNEPGSLGFVVFGDDYGWPWVYKTESFKTADFSFDGFDRFYWPGLTGDIVVGIMILVEAIIVVEWACRIISRRFGRQSPELPASQWPPPQSPPPAGSTPEPRVK